MINYNLDISEKSKWTICENKNLSLPFFITESGDFECGCDYFTQRDFRSGFILIYTLSGQGKLFHNNRTCILHPKTTALIDCSTMHRYESNGKSWHFLWLHIDGEGIKSYNEFVDEDCYGVFQVSDSDFIHDLEFVQLLAGRSDTISLIQISNTLSDMLSTLLTRHLASRLNGYNSYSHYNDITSVISFIRANFSKDVTLDDMTALVNISKYHFIRLFKKQTGMTPYEYMINYRIYQAKRLLRTTDLSVNEISSRVGFASPSNFIQKFKLSEHLSPAAYRRETISLPSPAAINPKRIYSVPVAARG